MNKEEMKARLLQRMAERKAEEASHPVHPKECKCGGRGNIPMGQFLSGRNGTEFGCGYVKCDVVW